VRSDPEAESASCFLGARLTPEELRRLDRFRADRGLRTRTDAIRVLLRDAEVAPPASGTVPPTVEAQLEELVEDGWFTDAQSALTALVAYGWREFVRERTVGRADLRRAAREIHDGRKARRGADREGRGLLER
jgi:hypothetical protein